MPRGNPSKLIPANRRSKQEVSEIGRKGGIKSGESRRNKRDFREAAKLVLDLATTEQLDDNLKKMNIAEADRTNMTAIIARLTLMAQSGNIHAARLLAELTGDLSSGQNSLNVNVGTDERIRVYLPEKDKD
jgi:predicted ATP-grasp superfamily ATP-dependent carboligase